MMAEGGSEAFVPINFRLTRLEGDVAEVKSDIKALRADMRVDIGALRTEMREEMGALRSEMRGELSALREEMRAFREDMRGEFASIRDRFKSVDKELASSNEQVSYLRGRIEQIPTTLQLLGFVIAIFVASGITRYFGH